MYKNLQEYICYRREVLGDLFGDILDQEIWDAAYKLGKEESHVLCEECPAQNTMEICHTAPNSQSKQCQHVFVYDEKVGTFCRLCGAH